MTKISFVVFASLLFTGCASVKMESQESADRAKQFVAPSQGQAGLYIYRDSGIGRALKKEVRVDGNCVGTTAPDVFFFTEVQGNKEHVISTESEFSPNTLKLYSEAGKNYFVRQYIKMGVFVGGADLELIPEAKGKEAVAKLGMATPGTCSGK